MLSWVSALQSVTPTGIEPVLPPWKGDVLTAWPWSHIYLLHKNILHKITPRVGLEPTTTRLTAECSTIELSRKMFCFAKHLRECCAFSVYCQVNVKKFYLFLQNRTLKLYLLYLNLHPFPIQNLWSSPRPISKCQLNTLLCLHLIPIYLVVFKGSYSFLRDISSWGGLHA